MENHDAAHFASETSLRRVFWLVRLAVRTCTYREVLVVQCALEPLLILFSDVPTLYVRPIEKHELELVTSTCTMSCNVLLHDYTRYKIVTNVLFLCAAHLLPCMHLDILSVY
jgi:hypothetical protein